MPGAAQPWSCVICTLTNGFAAAVCGACQSARPQADAAVGAGIAAAAAASKAGGVVAEPPQQWSCQRCTAFNPPSAKACELCGGTVKAQVAHASSSWLDTPYVVMARSEVGTKRPPRDTGRVREIKIIDQWGSFLFPVIKEYSAPSALCGYVTAALGLYMQTRYPLRMTSSEIERMCADLRDVSVLVPKIRDAIAFVAADRHAYVQSHANEFKDQKAKTAYINAWCANYELSDWLRAHAAHAPALHFVRRIERGKVSHEEARRLAEEQPFKAHDFFVDEPTPLPAAATASPVHVPSTTALAAGTARAVRTVLNATEAPANTMLTAADWIKHNALTPPAAATARADAKAAVAVAAPAPVAPAQAVAPAAGAGAGAAADKKAAAAPAAKSGTVSAGYAVPTNFAARNRGVGTCTCPDHGLVFITDLLGHYVLLKPVIVIADADAHLTTYPDTPADLATRQLLLLNSSHALHYTDDVVSAVFRMVFDGIAPQVPTAQKMK